MEGVRTSSVTSNATEARISNGKLSSTQFLCFWAVESPGVHNLSPRLSWVNWTSPTRHAPQTIRQIKIVIHGLPPTALPNLWKDLTAWKCVFIYQKLVWNRWFSLHHWHFPSLRLRQLRFFPKIPWSWQTPIPRLGYTSLSLAFAWCEIV